MTSRREVMLAAMAATSSTGAVIKGACDCHTHIFGDPSRFPFVASRSYTPNAATPKEMSALHAKLGVERVVIVTPSVYGTDNSATLYGIKERGKTARGIAVIDERTTDRDLATLDKAGFRGIRINLATAGIADPAVARERFEGAMKRLKPMTGWHLQLNVTLPVVTAIRQLVMDAPAAVVFDHMCAASAAKGLDDQPGMSDLLALLKAGKAYVKVTNRFLGTTSATQVPLVETVLAANSERVLWGTDWPHPDPAPGKKPTEVSPFTPIDDLAMLNKLIASVTDEKKRRLILVENPARLYRF